MDFPDRADLFAVGRRYIRNPPAPTRINPNVVDLPGSNLNLFVGSTSLMGEAVVAAMAKCQRGLFFGSARLAQLDKLAADRYGLTRKGENPSTVDLVLARPTAAAGAGVIAAGSTVQTSAAFLFSLDVDAVFGAGDLTIPVTGTALEAGPQGNVPGGAISAFTATTFDATIVPSNPAPAAGGTAVESDAQFKGRIRSFFSTIRRGTLGAIRFGATTVPGVAIATAYEVENPEQGGPGGAVELIVGDANGNATTDMLQAVRNVLVDYRAAGIPVILSAGVVQNLPVSWQLAYQAGIDTVRAQESVRAITVALAQFLDPGAAFLRSDFIAGAKSVPGVILRQGSLVVPAGDEYPANNQTILRVRPEDVTFL